MAQQTRNPTGDGTFTGTWSGSAGTRYQAVDDHPDSSGTDKLTHGTTAGRGPFTYSAFSVPVNSSITNVQVLYYDQKTASQGASWGAYLRVGGTDRATNDAHNPANLVWTLRTATYTTNPATGAAWTVADVNGTGANPLQGFGLIATDASPTCEVASIQLVVNYTPPTATRGRVSVVEFEAPALPTRGRASVVELETPFVATRGRVSVIELEMPLAPTRGRASVLEFETPSPPGAPTRGRVSVIELEIPDLQPTRGRASVVEFEAPFVQTRGRLSVTELEVPFLPTRGRVSVIELQTPAVGETGYARHWLHVFQAVPRFTAGWGLGQD